MSRLSWGLGGALLLTTIVYVRLVPVYFCGFDDFTHEHRAAFEDSREPIRMITTTHFGSAKYRPLSRLVLLASYLATPDQPSGHRVRNLLFHLSVVVLVFMLARRIDATQSEAALSAALFGIHPLAHQTTAAALFTLNFAYAFALAALWMFLESYERRGKVCAFLLAGSSVCACIGLLTYEASIAVFGMYAFFLLWQRIRKHPPAAGIRPFAAWFAVSQVVPLAIFFGTRLLFVAERMPVISLPIVLKNIAIFASAFLLPVDLLLLNSLFGAPLPSELLSDRESLMIFVVLGILVIALAAFWFARSAAARQRVRDLPWGTLLFLVAGMGFALSPFLFFTDHASETYTYLPAAFWSIVVAIIINRVVGSGPAGRTLTVAVLLLAAAAAWMRTERVRSCAAVADRITSTVPSSAWSTGSKVLFADAPGIPPLNKFGLYGYRGIATIDPGDHFVEPLEDAFCIRMHNPNLKATVVSTEELLSRCTPSDPCFFVDANGVVTHR